MFANFEDFGACGTGPDSGPRLLDKVCSFHNCRFFFNSYLIIKF